jgi:Flp pilus assembly protein TadG
MTRLRDYDQGRILMGMCGRIKADAGQALVELALTMPLMIVLLAGAAELGRVAYASIEVANAARAAVSYGSQTATKAGDTTGISTIAADDAADVSLGPTTTSESCICSDGSASTCLATDCHGSNIETILTVHTQATFDPLIHLPGLPTTYTIHGDAVQKVMQ